MINIRSQRAKLLYWRAFLRHSIMLERYYALRVSALLKAQFIRAAHLVKGGQANEVESMVEEQYGQMYSVAKEAVKKAGLVFHEMAQKYVQEEKDTEKGSKVNSSEVKATSDWNSFMGRMEVYNQSYTAAKVVQVTEATKSQLRDIISKGIKEGKSWAAVAEDIRKSSDITNKMRAMRIARTEMHSAAVYSTRETAILGLFDSIVTKQWFAVLDERTRAAHIAEMIPTPEVVPLNYPYVRTGENLMYPGDPNGSAWNVVNCRCVEIYGTMPAVPMHIPPLALLPPSEPKPGKPKPPKEPAPTWEERSVWDDSLLAEKKIEAFRKKFNFASFEVTGQFNNNDLHYALDALGQSMADLSSRFEPAMKPVLTKKARAVKKFQLFRGTNLIRDDGTETCSNGMYWPTRKVDPKTGKQIGAERIQVAVGGEPMLQKSGHIYAPSRDVFHPVEDSIQQIVVHEYGHHLFCNTLTLAQQREWFNICNSFPFPAVDTIKKISGYAIRNSEEAFCESWVLYSHKDYARPWSRKLPPSIEDFFKRYIPATKATP